MNSDLKLKIFNYKCFGDTGAELDHISPINIIIGRNNSGKTALLEALEAIKEEETDLTSFGHGGKVPSALLETKISEEAVGQVFKNGHSSSDIPGGDDWEYGKRLIGSTISWRREFQLKKKRESAKVSPAMERMNGNVQQKYADQLCQNTRNPLKDKTFKQLKAERDIVPEHESDDLTISGNGQNFTNIIQKYIGDQNFDSELIEFDYLKEINKVFNPDVNFERILVQRQSKNFWEVNLEDTVSGRVALTHAGSGIKTILLAIFYCHTLPKIEQKNPEEYIFCFEELENNLHPAALRRLFSYIRDKAKTECSTFFITTHSNIVIDAFSKDDLASIYHTKIKDNEGVVNRVSAYWDSKGVLEDLDLRASDILQSNGVVWLEGPSDRIYFNRWMEVISGGRIREGLHYQCLCYGGALLAHLSSKPQTDEAVEQFIHILNINRNAIVLMDSDITKEREILGTTKDRIIRELRDFGGFPWVTKGKEVENYVPIKALEARYGACRKNVKNDPKQSFWNTLKAFDEKGAKRFPNKKVVFAEEIAPYIDEEGMSATLDLYTKAQEALERIKEWNRLSDA